MCQTLCCVLNIKDGPTGAVLSGCFLSGKSGRQLQFKVVMTVMKLMGLKQG